MSQSINLILKNHQVDICILPVVRRKMGAKVRFFEEMFHGYVQQLIQSFPMLRVHFPAGGAATV